MNDRELTALMAAVLMSGSYAAESNLNFSQAANYAERLLMEIDRRTVERSNVPQTTPQAQDPRTAKGN